MRSAKVFFKDAFAGTLRETEYGYEFAYDENYLRADVAEPVSLTLPLRSEPYAQRTLFSFFDGLIPEGWLLDFATQTWKLDPRDRMGLLLACCKDCIGAVSIIGEEDGK